VVGGDDPGADALSQARRALDLGEPEDARRRCVTILERDPADISALALLGQIELALNHDQAALRCFRDTVKLAPENVGALKDLALALSQTGDLAAGVAMLRRALALKPRYLKAHYFLSMMKRYSPGDPDLAALEALAAAEDSLSEAERVTLGFTLGKALDDIGDYERSFQWLLRANAVKRASMSYGLPGDLEFMDRVAEVFDESLLAQMSGHGHATQRPVLIVGMPRSGTTLVEQIIASHPAAGAGGELADLSHVAASVTLLGDTGAAFPEGVRELGEAYLAHLGAGYDARLERLAPAAVRVTDKNPFNFAYLGIAALIVPHAHVIHCVRDPLDACVSCFSLDFREVKFGFDLAELGGFHRGYQRLMEHWRGVLPADWVLEARYEDVVADLEGHARRIIAHCGLPWDDRCLRFQDAAHNVRTASFAQVRRPLSRASVGRWRRYEPWLGPLRAALEG
jgi:tetratricopeptide (TPR) repeat protein